ncbi:Monoamine oxidase N [Fonsecaea pedrosoi]|nr:Monoamine oxidase N [Fonsecaea pedrosoi]
MLSSAEGFEYSPTEGLKAGLPTPAVINPHELNASTAETYDVIVIGAGYAGLITARDLTSQGRKVLLIEGRDRIGGRTWTSYTDGHAYEMGGTWIHWHQPHLWTEVTRYGLNNQIKDSLEMYPESAPQSTYTGGSRKDWSLAEITAMQEKSAATFLAIDGKHPTEWLPYPHNPSYNRADYVKYDRMSVQDRLDQLDGVLSEEEMAFTKANLGALAGIDFAQISLFDIVQRWLLCGMTQEEYMNHMARYKLKCGQTGLARCIFDDACSTGKLSYSFSNSLKTINSSDPRRATVTCADGRMFSARQVVCTIPLTVLRSVSFFPELPPLKAEAIAKAKSNPIRKLHVQVGGKQWKSWAGAKFAEEELVMVMGESHSPSGKDTNLVAFHDGANIGDPRIKAKELVKYFEGLHPDMKVKRFVFADYTGSPFSNGGWCVFQPDYMSKYLEALQEPVGNVKFASGDYSDGWRGFIDGAIEGGIIAARAVERDLRSPPRHPKLAQSSRSSL